MNASRAILTFKYAEIAERLADRAGMSLDGALEALYSSDTYLLMSNGVSDMHCMSVDYLVEELVDELKRKSGGQDPGKLPPPE